MSEHRTTRVDVGLCHDEHGLYVWLDVGEGHGRVRFEDIGEAAAFRDKLNELLVGDEGLTVRGSVGPPAASDSRALWR